MFCQIPPRELDSEYLGLLEASQAQDDSKVEVEDLYRFIVEGLAQLWVFKDSDGSRGLVITQVTEGTSGRELYVWRLLGVGMAKHFEEMQAILESFGRQWDCLKMRAVANADVTSFLLHKGYTKEGNSVYKELPNGSADCTN